ncbi:MBL fold metallo-hydrolase [Tepidamorphus sp. 3E244]|uniref:MBL fold metallo-hydrolase n=1 Tax=Tepidamorphus sp. 3E244 TaxID=3385498 RepID=UPI0038FCE71D
MANDQDKTSAGASSKPKGSPRFDLAFQPEYGTTVPVATDVLRIVCENPSPFTFKGTGTFIVTGGPGSREAAVIDPGPIDEKHLGAILGALDGYTLTHILVTHTHHDHSPLAQALKEATGAPITGCAAWSPRQSAGGEVKRGLDAANDADYTPDETMSDGDTIGIGGRVLTAIATPGHAANHLAFSLDDEVLFPGDHVMGWSTTVIAPPDGHMRSYMESLEKILAREEAHYLPSHGGEIRNPHRYVRGLITHRKQRETQIVKRLKEGDTTISQMVPKLYPELDAKLHFAAALSVRAHIDDLIERGIAERIDGDDAYRLVQGFKRRER